MALEANSFANIKLYVKPISRLCLIVLLIYSSVSISLSFSWTSLICIFCLSVSYIFFKTKTSTDEEGSDSKFSIDRMYTAIETSVNPFKGKTGTGKLTISPEKESEFYKALDDSACYDATKTKSVENFESMKQQSDCVFAKKARIWGSPEYIHSLSLEENIKRIYPTFLRFVLSVEELGLEAFVIELPGDVFGSDIQIFGDAVRRTLLTLKNCDNIRKCNKARRLYPSLYEDDTQLTPHLVEDTNKWSKRKWVFEIYMATFFVTTFAPFYPSTNSRYNFDLRDCYILFQPEHSFAVHDLPPDTPITNWTSPITVRDRIRKAFHDSGREYVPPMVDGEPMVFEIVKRVEPEDESSFWWMDNKKCEK